MASRRLAAAALLAVLFAIGSAARAEAQYLVSGNDEKRSWDENGQAIAGPPTSLAITPDNRLALIANGLLWTADGTRWKGVPDDKLFVVDLAAAPPRVAATIAVGRQPAGMAINRAGTLALVANRADDSVSVLAIKGSQVTLL